MISATCFDAVEKIGTVMFIEVAEVPFEEALPENRVAFRVHDYQSRPSQLCIRRETPRTILGERT